MSQSTHIGIFLKFQEGDVEIKTTVLKSPETGKEFPLHGDVKFCPSSGKELVEHVNTKMEKLNVQGYIEDEIEGLDEDAFWTPEGCRVIMIPNESSDDVPFMSRSFGSYDNGGYIDLTEVDIQDTIEKFKQKYAAYLKYYEGEYGPVEVMFGAVSYWS
ncbi:MAG: hypothetical protein P8J32_03540 [bacterium]|nr:hypothetical protein [bacterium]